MLTSRLEFHHVIPWAQGGRHTVENTTLRCSCHNRLAAEQDFDRAHLARVARARR